MTNVFMKKYEIYYTFLIENNFLLMATYSMAVIYLSQD